MASRKSQKRDLSRKDKIELEEVDGDKAALLYIMQEKKKSIKDIAVEAVVSDSTLYDIKNGKLSFTPGIRENIARKYKISIEWLNTNKGPFDAFDPDKFDEVLGNYADILKGNKHYRELLDEAKKLPLEKLINLVQFVRQD